MRKINGIGNESKQLIFVPLQDGGEFSLSIEYNPRTYRWGIKELIYQDFILKGFKIFNSNNILHQYRNLIPFGIACYSTDGREPMLIDDFAQGFCSMYILSREETQQYWKHISGQ